MNLNLGCGRKPLPGYINCDRATSVPADRHFDLDQVPYPFDPDSVDEILMDNVLEHLEDVLAVMTELHRILKPGGRLRVIVPYAKTDWAVQDPTHRHHFTEKSFDYFLEGNEFNFYSPARFRLIRARLFGNSLTLRHRLRNLLPFKSVLRYFFWNVYDGIDFELEKVSTADAAH